MHDLPCSSIRSEHVGSRGGNRRNRLRTKCDGSRQRSCEHHYRKARVLKVEVIVTKNKPLGYDCILGNNAISALGGVQIDHKMNVSFSGGSETCFGVKPRATKSVEVSDARNNCTIPVTDPSGAPEIGNRVGPGTDPRGTPYGKMKRGESDTSALHGPGTDPRGTPYGKMKRGESDTSVLHGKETHVEPDFSGNHTSEPHRAEAENGIESPRGTSGVPRKATPHPDFFVEYDAVRN